MNEPNGKKEVVMKLMQVEGRTIFKRFELPFIIIVFALNIVGLINLYSASHGIHATGLNRLFLAQLVWLIAGWILFLIITLVDYQFFVRSAYFLYGVNVLALIAVMAKGKTFYGAQRWIDLGFFRYQPSETMKVCLVLVLARVLAKYSSLEGLSLRDLVVPGVLTAIPFVLTVKQPDLGTALLLLAISGAILIFIGVRRKIIIAALLLATLAAIPAWKYGLKEYQKNRVITFLYPERDPRGTGYNSIQSKIAVGSGGVMGRGWRKGTQSQLEFLPERHTDFIFSVLSEEHGFVGSILTIGLFMFLFTKGLEIARQARDRTGVILTIGLLSYIFFHVLINIGMVTSLMPIVGVPLPFLSYGGSSMLTTMGALGLISSVAFRKYLF
jgi:rod shape determining protein RodA